MRCTIRCIFIILLGFAIGCSSSPRAAKRFVDPAPANVRSVVFRDQAPEAIFLADYYEPVYERTRFNEIFLSYRPNQSRLRRFVERGMTKAARVVDGRDAPTADDIVGEYEDKVDDAEKRFDNIERFVTRSLGIKEDEFRAGVGVTAATAATTLTALHMFHPVAVSDNLFGTKFRAGYDVSKINNPKMLLSYDNLGLTLSKRGIGGTFGTLDGRVYSADLNLKDQSAAANMSLNDSVSLGTLYSHRTEEIKGFVQLSF